MDRKNKVYAVKKQPENEWWAVIDCGPAKDGGMTTGNFWRSHFKKDGISYRWFRKLFGVPEGLKEWAEIKVKEANVCMIAGEKEISSQFEGWDDQEDLSYLTLQKFALMLGKELSIEEIKSMINHG